MSRLIGQAVPDVSLAASNGSAVNLSKIETGCVLFCYPYTGRPDHPDPPGWDHIPGAHGSTPQALAFARLYPQFQKRGISVFGLSFQDFEWQSDFATRNTLPFLLLSDAERAFATSLSLQTFVAGEQDYLHRQTFIIKAGRITNVFDPVSDPERNASDVLDVISP